MTPRLALGLWLLLALALPALPVHASDADPEAALCERAIVAGARRGGVPPEVLHAIALTETGRKSNGRVRPYPWAINREGKGFWFATRDEAMAFARASLAEGRESFDVGCVQINFRWHGHAFPSLDDMFDPEWTATYAAQFLRNLYEERGSWSEAAGAYHSLTPERAQIYRARFDRLLAGLDPSALTEAEALVASAVPVFAGGGRAARRAAERQAMVERIRSARLEPPPAPVMGSVGAGHMIAPAAGGLLVQGSTLLTEGRALLVAPSGSLF
ncbi:MAG TPA: lytic transglycosylase domain-containing protein [Amaricoccus sp.]|uniref:lytic transglycosylase domain-containing protein n=1 Tax=Amaricoccus sp. TaxID=1872485 RepID=UPI002B650EF6|nr:lytic transglycosylase domain-containing protein [Amaricoccus sp.]HMQ91534.1 lytic transglycosylase domain-containing protein [Amaricoccus sp.]HMR50953.1 lytic transglycosylase domain-containing protein [Amaricoccus sp.]HMR60440.1 lytic transglycosylase domain-containing protein [Amaricoccus sp.]HMT97868.1 lytic transglycosylase domain-containing protein [Amaricoccus sp.]